MKVFLLVLLTSLAHCKAPPSSDLSHQRHDSVYGSGSHFKISISLDIKAALSLKMVQSFEDFDEWRLYILSEEPTWGGLGNVVDDYKVLKRSSFPGADRHIHLETTVWMPQNQANFVFHLEEADILFNDDHRLAELSLAPGEDYSFYEVGAYTGPTNYLDRISYEVRKHSDTYLASIRKENEKSQPIEYVKLKDALMAKNNPVVNSALRVEITRIKNQASRRINIDVGE